MPITFIHTADWQIGKPFRGVEEATKQAQLSEARIHAIERIAALAEKVKASFVVVAGDLWDSATPSKSVISKALGAIGKVNVPVYIIPGNHDHGAFGGIWHNPYFIQEKNSLAPNLNILLEPKPVEIEEAILLPCPLLRKHENTDLSQWLRDANDVYDNLPADKPRIVLAHGSITTFGSETFSDEEEDGSAGNIIDLTRLPLDQLDYIALGDWHGTKKINEKAWYSGTPEPDRFPKGEQHQQGNSLVVEVQRGRTPKVKIHSTGAIIWQIVDYHFAGDDALSSFQTKLDSVLGNRVGSDLLLLRLTGSLSLNEMNTLQSIIETYQARLIRVKLDNQVQLNPNQDELDSLIRSESNPLIARVAQRIVTDLNKDGKQSDLAQEALKRLYFLTKGE